MPRLVLVNDDPTQLAMTAGILSKDGCEVVRFLSSPEALEACRTMSADLVVSDLNMPDMGGDQLLVALRELPGYAHTPIILVSASEPRREVRDVCEPLLQGRGQLLAPYRLPELRRAVRSYFTEDAPPLAPEEPVLLGDFDPTPVGKLLEAGGPAFAAKIVGMFLTKVPANLAGLEAALAADDWITAERLAHSTRGSAGMVGARKLGDLAGAVEEQATRQERGAVAPLHEAFGQARLKLEALLAI